MEYISREDYCEENCGKENRKGYKICKNCGMLNIPTADVQPIVHGQWHECYNDYYHISDICSHCGKASIRPLSSNPYKFCPNCGARMDLKGVEKNEY